MKKRFSKLLTLCMAVLCTLMTVGGVAYGADNVTVVMGDTIKYSRFWSDSTYSTKSYKMIESDGSEKIAYCIEANKGSLPSGTYTRGELNYDPYVLLLKVLCYGYGGPYDKTAEFFGNDAVNRYLATHICASYAYNSIQLGHSDYTGLPRGEADFEDKTNKNISPNGYSIGDFVRYCAQQDLGKGTATIAMGDSSKQKIGYISYWEVNAEESFKLKLTVHKKGYATNDYDESLAGAEYTLFKRGTDKDTVIAKEAVTKGSKSGNTVDLGSNEMSAYFNVKLKEGVYYIKETKAPQSGYWQVNDAFYEFTIKKSDGKLKMETGMQLGEDRVEIIAKDEIVHKETKYSALPFSVKKVDEFSGEAVAGAGFSVWRASDVKKSFKDMTGSFGYVDPYDFTKADPLPITSSGDTVMYSDENGLATTIALEPDLYLVKEVVTPPGYYDYDRAVVVDPVENTMATVDYFEVDLNKYENPVYHYGNVENEPKLFKLKIVKTDSVTSKPILSANTTFNIYNVKKGTYLTQQVTVDGTTTTTKDFNTDANGVLILSEAIRYGTYRIEEAKTPNGHFIKSAPVEITVDDNWNAENAKKDSDGNPIYEITFVNQRVYGQLDITKVGEVLTGYTNGKFVWDLRGLKGATFNIYAEDNIFDPVTGKLVYGKNDFVTTLTTGENGKASHLNMLLGKYYFVETSTLPGYILDKTPVHFELKKENETAKLVTKSKTVVNERSKIKLDVKKYGVDGEEKTPLAGAKFGLYTNENILNHAGVVICEKDSLISEAESGSNGIVNFDIDLPFGSYTIKEISAPDGYKKTDKEFAFEVKTTDVDETGSVKIETSFDNEKKKNPFNPKPDPEEPSEETSEGKTEEPSEEKSEKPKKPKSPKDEPKPEPPTEEPSTEREAYNINYRTEDSGENGYSVVVKEPFGIKWGFVALGGVIIIAAAFVIGYFKIRKDE